METYTNKRSNLEETETMQKDENSPRTQIFNVLRNMRCYSHKTRTECYKREINRTNFLELKKCMAELKNYKKGLDDKVEISNNVVQITELENGEVGAGREWIRKLE